MEEASDWTLSCPTNCTVVLPRNLSSAYSNSSDAEEDLLLQTFLDGSRFWIQRVLLPIVVVIGVFGNGKLENYINSISVKLRKDILKILSILRQITDHIFIFLAWM